MPKRQPRLTSPASTACYLRRMIGYSYQMRALMLMAMLISLGGAALAQVESIERTFKGRTGQDIRIGIFASIRSDCKSGPLPTIRLSGPPAHGNVTVKEGKLRTTNLKQCLAAEVPALVVNYKSKPEFSGSDVLTLEIANPNGKTQLQKITVTVDANPGGEKI
jgi:hypothetical protein